MFQHTAARRRLHLNMTNSRGNKVFQHTAARRRLPTSSSQMDSVVEFQHTAARRRLLLISDKIPSPNKVSTHSRPKAAATNLYSLTLLPLGFNTQPPEGGCASELKNEIMQFYESFNTQPPEGGCRRAFNYTNTTPVSTHSRPKAAALNFNF